MLEKERFYRENCPQPIDSEQLAIHSSHLLSDERTKHPFNVRDHLLLTVTNSDLRVTDCRVKMQSLVPPVGFPVTSHRTPSEKAKNLYFRSTELTKKWNRLLPRGRSQLIRLRLFSSR